MAVKFFIACPDYVTVGYRDRPTAERRMAEIAEAETCRLDHVIVEAVDRNEAARIYTGRPAADPNNPRYLGRDDDA